MRPFCRAGAHEVAGGLVEGPGGVEHGLGLPHMPLGRLGIAEIEGDPRHAQFFGNRADRFGIASGKLEVDFPGKVVRHFEAGDAVGAVEEDRSAHGRSNTQLGRISRKSSSALGGRPS